MTCPAFCSWRCNKLFGRGLLFVLPRHGVAMLEIWRWIRSLIQRTACVLHALSCFRCLVCCWPQVQHRSISSGAITNSTTCSIRQHPKRKHIPLQVTRTFCWCIVCVRMTSENSNCEHQQRRELHCPHACQLCSVSKTPRGSPAKRQFTR